MLGEQPHAEGRDELKNDGGRDVLHTIHQLQGEPPERRTGHDAAGDREQKRRGDGADGEAVRGDGADGQAVDQECARVVQQALAFEDRQDAMRRPQLAEHGGCGDGVGWSDDGARAQSPAPTASTG